MRRNPPRGPEIALSIALRTRRGIPSRGSFAAWAALATPPRLRGGLLSIRIVGAAEGRALNRRWRGRDYATNVLAFPADPGPRGAPRLLGDLVLCAPVIAAEARAHRKPPRNHWAHLTVHGILHLAGYDHEHPEAAERMQAIERNLLIRIGIRDPYAAN